MTIAITYIDIQHIYHADSAIDFYVEYETR